VILSLEYEYLILIFIIITVLSAHQLPVRASTYIFTVAVGILFVVIGFYNDFIYHTNWFLENIIIWVFIRLNVNTYFYIYKPKLHNSSQHIKVKM